MKRKLSIAFTLITLSLVGIVIFQGYWTVNAYRVNKKQFDNDIDTAMLRAMDDCKKDYFDSIRVVIIKRISAPDYVIKIDTITTPDSTNSSYDIRIGDKSQSSAMMINSPYTIRKLNLDYYKTKMKFKGKESIPALLTEMAFYVPRFLYQIMFSFQGEEMNAVMRKLNPESNKAKQADTLLQHKAQAMVRQQNPNPFMVTVNDTAFQNKLKALVRQRNLDTGEKGHSLFQQGLKKLIEQHIAALNQHKLKPPPAATQLAPVKKEEKPPVMPNWALIFKQQRDKGMPSNYHKADSVKINKYFKKELEIMNIYAPFTLSFSNKSNRIKIVNARHSETTEFPYRYHGMDFLTPNLLSIDTSYTKAIFKSPQYAVMRNMLINLTLSLLLILLTGFCFLYVYRTILEQKNLAELKDDFINNMTHELKTPIATITVAIEGLQNFNALNDVEKTQRYLQTSREQLDRLNQLVTKVLNVAAFENKEIDLNIQEIDIDEMVNNIISSEKLRSAKTVNISYINTDSIHQMHADKLHLNNVLLNLVDNAVKYAGDPVEVEIAVYKFDDKLRVAVKDNGIGIPAEHLAHIFDKFYRVPTGNVHNVKGTGLGLSYVNYIVGAHGGSITVQSTTNKGSEFIVTLPLS